MALMDFLVENNCKRVSIPNVLSPTPEGPVGERGIEWRGEAPKQSHLATQLTVFVHQPEYRVLLDPDR